MPDLRPETFTHVRGADARNRGKQGDARNLGEIKERSRGNLHVPRCFVATAGSGACAHLSTIEAAMRKSFTSNNCPLQVLLTTTCATYNHTEVMGRRWSRVGGVALVSASVAN